MSLTRAAGLASAALLLQYGLGLLLGVAAARRPGTLADHLIRFFSLLLYSQPVFWLGLMAILLLSLALPILPASHMRSVNAGEWGTWARLADLGKHLLLPALVIGLRGRFAEPTAGQCVAGRAAG